MASNTSITEGPTGKAGLPTSHSLAAFTHVDPQACALGS